MVDEDTQARRVLWQIRMVHTIAWVVFASSIVAIPIVTLAGRIHTALWLSLLVWVEVLILAANRPALSPDGGGQTLHKGSIRQLRHLPL